MNQPDFTSRHDELGAGRALGNLDAIELRELASVEASADFPRDEELELLAASLEVQAALRQTRSMPEGLAKRLHSWAGETPAVSTGSTSNSIQANSNIIRPKVSAWEIIAKHPVSGWVAAAAAVVLALMVPRGDGPVDPKLAESRLRAAADDLIERAFSGLGDFKQASGTVVWSDRMQQGFMTLSGIPANDPTKAQYQLWIVDPARDPDSPVDGGVFDIPAGAASVVVPIDAKLAIRSPQAFVITREQPGGVVKSKQETVVALAKNG